MKFTVIFLLCALGLKAGTCKIALVTYEAVTALSVVPDGKLTTTTQTIGCIDLQGETLLVIRTLSGGKAIDAIAIPAGAVTSVIFLEAQHAAGNNVSPQALPNVPNPNRPRNPNLTRRHRRPAINLSKVFEE